MNKENLIGQVKPLIDLIEYQESSIVSRTVIDKSVGTVTVFAFDTGQGLSEHTAPFDALVYVIDGEAEVIISGVSWNVKQGQMLSCRLTTRTR